MRQILAIETIVSDPAVRSGRPVIAGTQVMVSDIAIYHDVWMQTPDEIAAQLDLTLGQVHAALAYYFDHKAEIDAEIAESERIADELREELTRGRD